MNRRVYIRSDASLDSTASQLFEILAIPRSEERDSVSFPGGRYFRGKLGELQVSVSHTDPEDKVFEDCRCAVDLETGDKSPYDFGDVFSAMVTRLLEAGCYVIREVGANPDAVECVVYQLRDDGELLATAESRPIPS